MRHLIFFFFDLLKLIFDYGNYSRQNIQKKGKWNIYNFMTSDLGLTLTLLPSAEDHVTQSEAPEQLLIGHVGEIVLPKDYCLCETQVLMKTSALLIKHIRHFKLQW